MEPKFYLVGGAVRDHLLGIISRDRDWVVIGATPEWMESQGYKKVGAAFPVFLHPETGEEYALARREKKVAPGYHGFEVDFSPEVTLEEDLSRRDLTINSMAMDEDGALYDPFNGREDLKFCMLRHTSVAFAEDPVRVLRVARFAARYSFTVAESTLDLCRELVIARELDEVSPDRIWAEMYKMLAEPHFCSSGLKVLREVGAVNSCKQLRDLFTDSYVDTLLDTSTKLRETKMTRDERAFWYTAIPRMGREVLLEQRVPAEMYRKTQIFMRAFLIFSAWKTSRWSDLIVGDLVRFFDTYRSDFNKPETMSDLHHFIAVSVDAPKLVEFLPIFTKITSALYALDFTDLVKGMQPRDIRDFVLRVKESTVADVLESNEKGELLGVPEQGRCILGDDCQCSAVGSSGFCVYADDQEYKRKLYLQKTSRERGLKS